MTYTTKQLDAMLAAATPGPWQVSIDDGDEVMTGAGGESLMCDMTCYPWVPPSGDWPLIAAAPTITAELIAARRKLDAVQGLVEAVEAYKSASKSEMVIPADRGGQWGPKGSAIAKTLERKGEMFAALAAWEVAQ